MRAGTVVNVTRADRRRLEALVSDRSAPQKHVCRAQVILSTGDGCGTTEIMRRSGKAKPVSGDGRRGSWLMASTGCCATRHAGPQAAASRCHGSEGHRPRDQATAGRDHSVDGSDAGQDGGDRLRSVQRIPRGPQARAAQVRRETQGSGRSLRRSSRPRGRPLG
jgi:hypothetical protein